jgi:hypothetical protein
MRVQSLAKLGLLQLRRVNAGVGKKLLIPAPNCYRNTNSESKINMNIR